MKLNKNREMILDFIIKYNKPVSSKEISKNFTDTMDQATVYRNLLFLEENNYIESFKYNCDKVGSVTYYLSKKNNHFHFLHCLKCHNFQALEECNENRIKKLENKNNVIIQSHVNYFKGICSNCNN